MYHFQPFIIEFNNYKIKCIKHIKRDNDNSFDIYRGIEINLNQIFNVYEYRIRLDKNGIFEKKKLEYCQIEVSMLFIFGINYYNSNTKLKNR